MGIGNDAWAGRIFVAELATACGHRGLRVRCKGVVAGYNDKPVLATAATSRCRGYHNGNWQRPAGVNNVRSGIGNDELAATIPHVGNGNGNDVRASRVPWWYEHR